MSRLAALLLALGAHAAEPVLAPTLQDLDASVDRVARLVARATEAETALAASQEAWISDGCAERRCAREHVVDLVFDLREGGGVLRRELQGARAELARARRIAAFPPLKELLDQARLSRLDGLGREVDRQARAYAARVAWTESLVEPVARGAGLDLPVCPPAELP